MGIRSSYEGIDEYVVQIIQYKARQLVGKYGFTEYERKDLEQEMFLDFLCRLPKFNPKRAKMNTFITLIVNNKVATIIKARESQMRDYRLCTSSLNDQLDNEGGDTMERGETIDQEDYFHRTGRLSCPAEEAHDLSIDAERAVAGLPPDLRVLCGYLQTHSISEISRETGIPRGTIYESRKRLRALFEDAGLKKYL